MKKTNKKGFTLVELLAVIVILAIILLIAVPNVLGIIEKTKKDSFCSTAKLTYKGVEYFKMQYSEEISKAHGNGNWVAIDFAGEILPVVTEVAAADGHAAIADSTVFEKVKFESLDGYDRIDTGKFFIKADEKGSIIVEAATPLKAKDGNFEIIDITKATCTFK